jgi:hypothetical protein
MQVRTLVYVSMSLEIEMTVTFALALYAALHTAASQPLGIDDVAWLTGCWEYSSGSRTVEEHWLAPRAHSMVNIGRTVQADKLVEYEMVLIREQERRLAYEAHPSGQPSAVFMSRMVGNREVVFENLQHDFPQRVGYKRDGDSLLAWIEGPRNGQMRRIEFPYRKVACGGD